MQYIGANNCALVYDDVSGRFGWEYLHVSENVGQPYNAGSTDIVDKKSGSTNNNPIISDADAEVYKINKRLETWSYCPDMVPYLPDVTGGLGDAFDATEAVAFNLFNPNIKEWAIFDAHMGINLNFGKTAKVKDINKEQTQQEVWNNSLLGVLGFSWEQFNPLIINNQNNQQARVTYNNIRSLYNPTTNCQIVNTDIKAMIVNPYGAVQYVPQLPQSFIFINFHTTKDNNYPNKYGYYPAISEDTESIKIEGVRLPKKVEIPYLTIRSDIISTSKYVGSKQSGLLMPILAVVNKINADKDFIQLENSNMVFTLTEPLSFSSITTSITNPDGSLANTDDGNAVIYKITKMNNLQKYNVAEQILKDTKKDK